MPYYECGELLINDKHMTIDPIKVKRGKGMVRRYWCQGYVGNIYVSVTGHTHAYALHRVFQYVIYHK